MIYSSATRFAIAVSMAALTTACEGIPDFDLRDDLGSGFDTTEAVQSLPARPRPDARGVISYPNYQVVVAQTGDTISTIASRLGLNAGELARFNGIEPDTVLRRDELVALPQRLPDAPAPSNTGTVDIAGVATSALARAEAEGAVSTTTLEPETQQAPTLPASPTQTATGPEPIRHKVERGQTVFIISRLYNVPPRSIAEWNGLGSDFAIREGQFLLIPQPGVQAPASSLAPSTPVTQPGTGSATPLPPSATAPLPDEVPPSSAQQAASDPVATPAAPDLGTPTQQTTSARLQRPVDGSIIRDYSPGRNEGIDIGAPAGTDVRAADAGSVAAVTTDTAGVAIVVIRHADDLLTVYTNIDNLTVEKGDTVSRGQVIAKVHDASPSFLHFEVRKGLQSADPSDFLQ